MSIWCSLPNIGFDDEVDESVGQVRSYASGWSNHYPTTDGTVERDATLDLAYIPAWCAGGDDDDFRVPRLSCINCMYRAWESCTAPVPAVGRYRPVELLRVGVDVLPAASHLQACAHHGEAYWHRSDRQTRY